MSSRWRLVRAGTDAVPASIRRFFQARRVRPRQLRGRPWALAGTVVVVVMLAGWVVAGTSLFGVRQVRVTGTEIVTPAQVRDAAAVPEQTPLLRVRTDQVAARITAALPPVAQAQVSRDWPGTMVVAVTERTPVAVVPVAEDAPGGAGEGSFLLLDAEGVPFHAVPRAPLDLPLAELADPGPDDRDTRAALTVLAALTPPLRSDLETLTVAGPASIELSLLSGMTILWGDETGSEDKARVATALLEPATLLDQEALPGQEATVIDVSSPEVVAVR